MKRLRFIPNTLFSQILMTFLPLFAIGLYWVAHSAAVMSQDFEIQRIQSQLVAESTDIRSTLDLMINQRSAHLSSLLRNPIILSALKNNQFEAASLLLKEEKDEYKLYHAIHIYDLNGNLKASSSKAMMRYLYEIKNGNFSDRSWFKQALAGIKGFSDPEYSQTFNSLIVNFYGPVVGKNGTTLGVIRLVYAWKYIQVEIEKYEKRARSLGIKTKSHLILGENDKILHHSDSTLILRRANRADLSLDEVIGSSDSGVVQLKEDGANRLVAYSREATPTSSLPNNWTVITTQSYDEISTFVDFMYASLITSTVTIGLLLMLATLILTRYVSAPTRHLNRAVAHASQSVRFDQQLSLSGTREIQTLVRSFNSLFRNLRRTTVSKTDLDSILSSMTEMLITFDTTGKVKMANPAAQGVFGYAEREMTDQRFESLIQNSENEEHKVLNSFENLKAALKKTSIRSLVSLCITADGQRVPALFSASAIVDPESRELTTIVVVLTDLTMLNKLQNQLVHAEKLASIGELAAGLGHEINNPLTIVKGHLDLATKHLIRKNWMDEDIEKSISRQTEAINRIAGIVNGLRTHARSSKDDRGIFDVHTILENTLDLVESIYKNEGITLVKQLHAQQTCIEGDLSKFQQVVMNLLKNAKDAVRTTKNQKITISTRNSGRRIEIVFSDTGTGIKPENRMRIFDTFFTTKPVGEGTGIGLSLSAQFVQEMKGVISLDSELGLGTSFTLSFPTAEHPSSAANLSHDSKAEETKKLEGYILLVDDEISIRELLAEGLTELGLVVDQAADGRAGLQLLEKNTYDYVITDIKMPHMTGTDMIREAIKKGYKQTKYIVITGGVSLTEAELLEIENMSEALLQKPFGIDQLIKLIQPRT